MFLERDEKKENEMKQKMQNKEEKKKKMLEDIYWNGKNKKEEDNLKLQQDIEKLNEERRLNLIKR